jgi:hypothetical protein
MNWKGSGSRRPGRIEVLSQHLPGGIEETHEKPLATIKDVGFDVLTAVAMQSYTFWDITPCSLLKVNRRFGGTRSRYLLGLRISHAKKKHQMGARQVPPKRRLAFNGPHGVISQKTELCRMQDVQAQTATKHLRIRAYIVTATPTRSVCCYYCCCCCLYYYSCNDCCYCC